LLELEVLGIPALELKVVDSPWLDTVLWATIYRE
jgi:hypothetical protein